MKYSDELSKITLPGAKSVVRIYKDQKPIFDLICLSKEVDQILSDN